MNFKKLVQYFTNIYQSSKILDKLPEVVLYLDWEGNILITNETAKNYYGLLSNININDIVSDGMKCVRNSIKNKKAIIVNTKIYGNDFVAELNASKSKKNYYVTLRNKTPYIDNLEEIQHIKDSNNEKNIMISAISEDIQSPLNSISGFSQGLLDGIAGELSEKQIKYLKIIKSNTNDLQDFLNKFIDFSYSESSAYKFEIKKFDVVNSLKDTVKDLKFKEKYKNFNVDFNYDTLENRNIYFDEYTLKQIITNIIEFSYITTGNNNISIRISVPDLENSITFGLNEYRKYVQIYINDNSTGFNNEDIPNILDPYTQLKKSKKDILRSLCLGTANTLIKRMEGYIDINFDINRGILYNIIIPTEKVQDE